MHMDMLDGTAAIVIEKSWEGSKFSPHRDYDDENHSNHGCGVVKHYLLQSRVI